MNDNKQLFKTSYGYKNKNQENQLENINISPEYILNMKLRNSLEYYKGTIIEYL